MRAKKQAMNFYPITVSSAVHMDGTDKNLKDDYSDIKSEIDNARTATTGEKFNTIDERLNTEIGRLKKGFTDVNLIEQDSKERHFIHNTCKGHIHDLIIKGKTLMNLIKDGERTCTIDKSIDPNNRIYRFNIPYKLQRGKKYVGYIKIDSIENSAQSVAHGLRIYAIGNVNKGGAYYNIGDKPGIYKFTWNTGTAPEDIKEFHTVGIFLDSEEYDNNGKASFSNFMLFEEGMDFITINNYISDTESSGQKEDKISILSSGKNLTNCKFELGIWNVSPTDKEPVKQSNSNYVRSSELIDISKFNDQQISISLNGKSVEGNIKYYTKDRKYIKDVFNAPFNPVPNAFYITIHVPLSRFSKYDEFQIEPGSNSTSYESYKCDKKDILLSQYGFDEGLRGLNIYVYDELNYIRNMAIKRIEKYIVTGNENFMIDIRNDHMYCYFTLEGCKPGSGRDAICNQFNYVDALWDKDKVENQGKEGFDLSGTNSLTFQILLSKLETQDVEGVKKYFKTLFDEGNPVIVYYELAEPIEIPLKETIELASYDKDTYVLFENNIGGTSSFKLPVDISKTINSLIEERIILENRVSTVSNEINQIKTYMIEVLSNKE